MITYGDIHHASSRIRAINYIDYLENSFNWSISWLPRAYSRKKGIFNILMFAFVKRCLLIKRFFYLCFGRWDIIYVQRVFLSNFSISILRWRGIPFVFDFDDAIFTGSLKNKRDTIRMIKNSSNVIIASDELRHFCKEYGTNLISVIVSPVDTEEINERQYNCENNSTVTIGWIGSMWTEKYLEQLKPIFVELNKNSFRVLLIGASGRFEVPGVDVEQIKWDLKKENTFLQQMDIGVMPLTKDEWSKGKGGYKIYQYFAAGIPVVASPVGINKEIVEEGINGFLAEDTASWVNSLEMLIKDCKKRKKMGEAGRSKAEKYYSYKANIQKFDHVLKEALASVK